MNYTFRIPNKKKILVRLTEFSFIDNGRMYYIEHWTFTHTKIDYNNF